MSGGDFRKVAVVMGGPSAEREVSLSTGRECAAALREAGFDVTEIDAGDLPTLAAADRLDQGLPANREIASAKLYASEMLARVTDAAIQLHGGMGLMDDYPLERFWRDARVERIWDGTSEIQRHIISRDLLRALGA